MKIDLREIQTLWINLDSAKKNAVEMVEQFDRLGMKNHKRIAGRVIPPPKLPIHKQRAYGLHFVGCGQSHIDAMDAAHHIPFLVLEDDAAVTNEFSHVLDVPDDTDAVYLGISHGNKKQVIVDNGDGWFRVFGMLTTHAILYTSERFVSHAKQFTRECIYKYHIPLDNGFAALQKNYKILACPKPMFVQSNMRQSANQWESITNRPLVPTHVRALNELIPIPSK